MTEERPEGDIDRELEDPVFEELFAAMRATTRRPAPPMSPALTMLLAPGATGRRRRARGATVGLAVVGVLAGGVGAAAATGHLQRPAPVTRVAETDDPSGATTPAAPTPTDAVPPTATDSAPEPDPGSDREDRTTDVVGEDDAATPATRSPRASDDDETPGTGETGSDDDAEHGDDSGEGDEGDGGDDSGAEEPGDDEQPDDGDDPDEVDDGSVEDDGHTEVGDASESAEAAG